MSSRFRSKWVEFDQDALRDLDTAARSAAQAEEVEDTLIHVPVGPGLATLHEASKKSEEEDESDEDLTGESDQEARHSDEEDSPTDSNHGFVRESILSEEDTDDDGGSVIMFNLLQVTPGDTCASAFEKLSSFLVQHGVIRNYKIENGFLKIKKRSDTATPQSAIGHINLPLPRFQQSSTDSSPNEGPSTSKKKPVRTPSEEKRKSKESVPTPKDKPQVPIGPSTTVLDTTLNISHTFQTLTGRSVKLTVRDYCKNCPPSTRATKVIWFKHLKTKHNIGIIKTIV
ncbi:MAG: phosphoprotein [Alxa tick rhabdovirus]|uniref:Phosphoprotein n=1 Tax=Alxa tick rhabdovirus TaxID=2977131 RepID=A0A977WM89_9RHAB|nr:MAG: phosphoprotein [Alxa tick rhabdovirus]